MRKELTAHVHKYMGFLTETVYEMKGTTKLYIPQDDLSDSDSCVKNSDLKMRLDIGVFEKLGKEIQDSTTEAPDNLKFLSNASPDQIPSIIPLLLAGILLIWRLSK